MKKLILFSLCLATLSIHAQEKIRVHAVTDLAHEFTFYSDHRFYTQYLPNQKGETNWCDLWNFDFSNANLLILPGCDDRIAYSVQDIDAISGFLKSGGGVVMDMGHEAEGLRRIQTTIQRASKLDPDMKNYDLQDNLTDPGRQGESGN